MFKSFKCHFLATYFLEIAISFTAVLINFRAHQACDVKMSAHSLCIGIHNSTETVVEF